MSFAIMATAEEATKKMAQSDESVCQGVWVVNTARHGSENYLNTVSKYFCMAFLVFVLMSCSAVSTTARTVGTVGSVGWKAAKITGKTAYHTGNVAYKTGKFTSKAVRSAVYMGKGKQLIPLIKQGNSMYVNVKINGKASGRLLLDTGASLTQISQRLAKKLRIKKKDGDPLEVRIANGQIVGGRRVNLKEIRVKGVRVSDVTAIVLDHEIPGESDGLLGMSFLKHFSFEIDSEKGELLLQQKAR